MAEPWIQFKNWSFIYENGYAPALRDINLTLYRGEKVLILGANASGKSTFVRALRNQLGQGVFQGQSDGKIIRFGKDMATIDGEPLVSAVDQAEEKEATVMDKVDWQTLLQGKHPTVQNADLSISQAEIYRLISQAKYDDSVFIFDEPLANLSPQTGEKFLDLMDDVSHAKQASIVFVEYRLEQMLYRPIDRVIVLNEGWVVFDGQVEALLKSEILHTFFIREPLYVTAMRYAGYPLNQVANIGKVNHIYAPGLKNSIEKWMLSVPNFLYPENDTELISFSGVSYQYPERDHATIKGLNLTLNKGEIVSVLGGNGAGKTTLSRLLSGQFIPNQGQISWKRETLNHDNLSAFRRRVSYIPHDPWEKLAPTTVAQQLQASGLAFGMSEDQVQESMMRSLTALGLKYAIDFPIEYLSFGQQKRVLLAQALMFDSEILIIDEPTEGQDYYHYNELMQYIYTIAHEHHILVIINTHDIDLALEFSHRSLVLRDGQLLADTTPIRVAVDPLLIKAGGLRESSLYTFAKQIHLLDPYNFVKKFTNYNRAVNQ